MTTLTGGSALDSAAVNRQVGAFNARTSAKSADVSNSAALIGTTVDSLQSTVTQFNSASNSGMKDMTSLLATAFNVSDILSAEATVNQRELDNGKSALFDAIFGLERMFNSLNWTDFVASNLSIPLNYWDGQLRNYTVQSNAFHNLLTSSDIKGVHRDEVNRTIDAYKNTADILNDQFHVYALSGTTSAMDILDRIQSVANVLAGNTPAGDSLTSQIGSLRSSFKDIADKVGNGVGQSAQFVQDAAGTTEDDSQHGYILNMEGFDKVSADMQSAIDEASAIVDSGVRSFVDTRAIAAAAQHAQANDANKVISQIGKTSLDINSIMQDALQNVATGNNQVLNNSTNSSELVQILLPDVKMFNTWSGTQLEQVNTAKDQTIQGVQSLETGVDHSLWEVGKNANDHVDTIRKKLREILSMSDDIEDRVKLIDGKLESTREIIEKSSPDILAVDTDPIMNLQVSEPPPEEAQIDAIVPAVDDMLSRAASVSF
jgi:hypothetical protein